MKPGELELFSTEELIDELMRRTTFQGVIVHARDGAKSRHWNGKRVFRIRLNTESPSAGGQPPARRREPADRERRKGLVAR
jgi:hypothetical protein